MKTINRGLFSVSLTAGVLAFAATAWAQHLPGDARSAGLRYLVPDMACWWDTSTPSGYVTNGFIDAANVAAPLDNWEPYAAAVGQSTFLIEFNTYANDGSLLYQNHVVALQPAAGGTPNLIYAFDADGAGPFQGQMDLSRQDGNPGRVAGDKRTGGTNYIVQCESSLGQLPGFLSNRWSSNNIYSATDRYATEQVFTVFTNALATPVTLAWDYVYGPHSGNLGPDNGAPACSQTGGRPEFLDDGNIVVCIDDLTRILDPLHGEVATFSIITPSGAIVTGPTEADPRPVWDNLCAFQGGFCLRVQDSIYFYNDLGALIRSNNVATANTNLQAARPHGWGFTGGYDTNLGNTNTVGADILTPYVFMAGAVVVGGSGVNQSNACMMAIWNGQTGNFITNVMVSSDLDPAYLSVDQTAVAVNASAQICVAYDGQPNQFGGYDNQIVARLLQFDGQTVSYLTPSFFAFINSDNAATVASNSIPIGFTTLYPSVAMTPEAVCIAGAGSINSTNNPYSPGQPDSPPQTALYAVVNLPIVVKPSLSAKVSRRNLTLSWNAAAGPAFTLISAGKANTPLTSWATVSPQPPITGPSNGLYSLTVPLGASNQFFDLVSP
jgi:hypothetical protein